MIGGTFLLDGFLASLIGGGQGSVGVGPHKLATVEVSDSEPFVGQPIRVFVTCVEASGPITVEPPKSTDLSWFLVGVAGGGRAEFLAVARRPGPLLVPAFEVRADGRVERTRAFRLRPRPVPAAIRSAGFLGGVGALEVEASVEATEVRVGGTFAFRMTLKGPAALGSDRPNLAGLDRLGLGLEVAPGPTEVSADPPVRTFRWSLRAMKPGEAVLPPQRVAYFDPARSPTAALSRATEGIPIRALPAPTFDATKVRGPTSEASRVEVGSGWLPVSVAVVIAVVALGLALRAIRQHRLRPRRSSGTEAKESPRKLAARLASELECAGESPGLDGPEAARLIADAMTDYLASARGRSRGALTPAEAGAGIAAATDDEALGLRASELIERGDRLRFGDDPVAPPGVLEAAELLASAVALFRELQVIRPFRREGEPGPDDPSASFRQRNGGRS